MFIEAIAVLIGEALMTTKGVRRFGRHSFRATGVVHLALLGIAVDEIRLIGRWVCGVVIHYTCTAPLNILALEHKPHSVMANTDAGTSSFNQTTQKIESHID